MPRTLYLHTYSPIHIGSGVEIQPGEYALVGGEYYRIDPERLFGAIIDQHPDAHQQVVDWIEEQTEGLQTVDNRRASRQRQEMNLFSFVERALRDAPLARRLQTDIRLYSRYAMSAPASLRRSVREQLKTATNELYVPGSSIKGALRTALLYETLRSQPPDERRALDELLSRLVQTIKRQQRGKRAYLALPLENHVFGCGLRQRREFIMNDPRFSLLRFLVVSDTETRPAHEVGRVITVDAYQRRGDRQGQIPPCESINEGITLSFRLGFDVEMLRRIVQAIRRKEQVTIGRDRLVMGTDVWVDLEKKLARVFGLTFDDVLSGQDEEIEASVIERLLDACEKVGTATAKLERRWADENQSGREAESAREMIRRYEERPRGTLKLGWASGFPGVTLFALLVSWLDDPVLKRRTEELLPLLVATKGQRDARTITDRYPGARRFETRNNRAGLIGWVTINQSPEHPVPSLANRDEAQPAVETRREPEVAVDPADRPMLVKVGKNTKGILARVTGHQGRALVVELHVQGYQGQPFTVGGVNGPDFAKGEWITVDVVSLKKNGRIAQVCYGNRLS